MRMTLTRERELELVSAARRGDRTARAELWGANKALVFWAAKRFDGPDPADLRQAAAEGYLRALATFRSDKGRRFNTWAVLWATAFARMEVRTWLRHKRIEADPMLLVERRDHDDVVQRDWSDGGAAAQAAEDALMMEDGRDIVASLSRPLRVVLSERMAGYTLEDVAARNRGKLGLKGDGTRESVRKLEAVALRVAQARAVVS